MGILMMALLASVFPGTVQDEVRPVAVSALAQNPTPVAAAVGGAVPQEPPNAASSYRDREAAAENLGDFVGGRQVIFVAPFDVFLLFLLVGLVVLIIIL
jgi:hypothetical protein